MPRPGGRVSVACVFVVVKPLHPKMRETSGGSGVEGYEASTRLKLGGITCITQFVEVENILERLKIITRIL